ncbi:MAG TPA: DHA2 family efflux MFS transporter permease subunit [Archaeoglobus veneficus]|nr:DHA2 family efflux MFS transporter permease subunit [Archaeoglobus veneficus]
MKQKPWISVIPVIIGVFMVMIDVSILNVALPKIAEEFNASASDVQWILNAYTVTLVVLLILAGKIGDMVSRNYYYSAGMAIFTIGSYLCAESWDVSPLIAFRVFQAIGGAIMLGNSLAIMVELFPPGKRGTVMGINAILISSAFSLGPIIGGWLTTHLSWHWVFYINIPIGILGVVCGIALLPPLGKKVKEPIDFVGLALLSIGLGFLTLALIKGQDWGWTSQKTIASFIIAFPYILAFIVRELTYHHPLLDFTLFKVRNFSIGILGIFFMFTGVTAALFILPFFLQGIKGLTAEESGYWLIAIPIMNSFIAPVAGRLSDTINPKYTMCIGPIFFVLGLLMLSNIDINIGFWEMFLILSFLGIGLGLVVSPSFNVIMSAVPPQKAGMANGVVQTINSLGRTMGVALGGVIITGKMNDLVPGYGNQLPDPGKIMMLKSLAIRGFSGPLILMVNAFMESLHHLFVQLVFFPIASLFVILLFLSGKEHLKKMRTKIPQSQKI